MTIRYTDTKPSAAEYFDLFITTGWNGHYGVGVHDLNRVLEQSRSVVCAYDEGTLVGFGRTISDGVMHAMIFDLIVHPSHQGLGIGSEILERLVALCHAEGIRDIQLFSASGKASFYTKRGFSLRPDDAPGMERKTPGRRFQ